MDPSSGLGRIDTSKPVNLVLSGGGVKGVAHIALLEYLEKNKIEINAISATSAGALVGALYASGRKPKEILDFFRTTPIFRYSWLNPTIAGIFDSEKYTHVMASFTKERFEELEIPLSITATNLEEGRPVIFDEGLLIRPLVASCAIPAIFSPLTIKNSLYADGGVMDNFPIAPFLNDDHQILGSYVTVPPFKPKSELNSILKVSNHSNSLLMHAANEYKFAQTAYTFIYPLSRFGTLETKSIDRIYEEAKIFLDQEKLEFM